MADLRAYLFAEAERSLQTLLDNHVVSGSTHATVVSVLKYERDGTPVTAPASGQPAEPLGGPDPALKAYLLKDTERTLQCLVDNRFLSPDGHAKITSLLAQQRDEKGIPQQPPPGYIPPASAYSPSTQPQIYQGYGYPPAAYTQGYPQPGYGGYPPAYDQQGQYAYSSGQYGQQAPPSQYAASAPGQYAQQPQYGQPQYGQPYPYSQQYPQQQSYMNNPGIVGTPNVTPMPPSAQEPPKTQAPAHAQVPAAAPPNTHSQWGVFASRMGNNIANGMSSGFGWTMGGNVANEVFHDTMNVIHKI